MLDGKSVCYGLKFFYKRNISHNYIVTLKLVSGKDGAAQTRLLMELDFSAVIATVVPERVGRGA